MEEVELAYTAGVIDGEGSIYIVKSSKRGQQKLHVEVHMTSYVITKWLQDIFGGFHGFRGAQKPNHKDSYLWGVCDGKALKFLELVLPYLKLKSAQASLGIRFQNTKQLGVSRLRPLTEELCHEREQMRLQMKELNKRGPL